MNIIIPMAGEGSRFKDAGYTFPKPLIDVNGKPMIQRVVENIELIGKYIFIVQKKHNDKYNFSSLLNIIQPNHIIVEVDEVTQGAACSVLLAKKHINNNEELLIANSDQCISWNAFETISGFRSDNADGGILTFTSNHPKHSFAKVDGKGIISEVAEKNPISNNATVGIYWWKNGSKFVKYAEQMISKDIRTNNEFYVCPVYNEAILDNKIITSRHVNEMRGMGTPEELNNYLNILSKNSN